MERKGLVIGIAVVLLASVGILTYVSQFAATSTISTSDVRSNQRILQVIIPRDAYLVPEGWKGGYTFAERFYTPNTLIINIGDTVEWVNKDSLAHTVTFHKAPTGTKTVDSGPLEAGKSWAFNFKTPGEYEYHCNFHPYGAGKLVVKG